MGDHLVLPQLLVGAVAVAVAPPPPDGAYDVLVPPPPDELGDHFVRPQLFKAVEEGCCSWRAESERKASVPTARVDDDRATR